MNIFRSARLRYVLVVLAATITALSATPKLHGQSIGYSDFVDDEGEIEVTVMMAGNESEIDGYVQVDNFSFGLFEDIAFVSTEGDIYDGNSLVGYDADPFWEADVSFAFPIASTHVGDTYELDGWAAACYYIDEEGDCEPV